jgi:hypothetical protein
VQCSENAKYTHVDVQRAALPLIFGRLSRNGSSAGFFRFFIKSFDEKSLYVLVFNSAGKAK